MQLKFTPFSFTMRWTWKSENLLWFFNNVLYHLKTYPSPSFHGIFSSGGWIKSCVWFFPNTHQDYSFLLLSTELQLLHIIFEGCAIPGEILPKPSSMKASSQWFLVGVCTFLYDINLFQDTGYSSTYTLLRLLCQRTFP